jgi:hypothetical protein
VNAFLLGWLILSLIAIAVWIILLLSGRFHLKFSFGRKQKQAQKEETTLHLDKPSYVAPDYLRKPSSVEYYGLYSPMRAGVSSEKKRDLEEAEKKDELPHCPECGAAIGYSDIDCPKCGLRLGSNASQDWD